MNSLELNLFSVIFVFVLTTAIVTASDGDRSPFYQNCVKSCIKRECTIDGNFTVEAAKDQDVWCSLLMWGCQDECRYSCMWKTVDGFQERGYQIPKFHGKWPFKRVLGLQEPASVLASLLNLAMHYYKHKELQSLFPVKDTPLVLFWHVFAFVCMNAWSWSVVFHARDTPFTEFMDYACALSMVMALFVAAVVRIFHRKRKLTCTILLLPLLYYINHVMYLYTGRIDYNYNMAVNIFFGVAGSVLWQLWSLYQLRAGGVYAWRILLFTLLSGAVLVLEVHDFPPYLYAWDAHALWHLSTAPLPLIFYRFVIDDLHYLRKHSLNEKSH